jgi:hypothetical protein
LMRLGLDMEGKVWTGPDAVYFSTFCSSRFWPILTPEGPSFALASCLGRQAASQGWYVNPPPKMDLDRMLRADAIGRLRDNSMVPFLNAIFERTLSLTEHIPDTKLFFTRDMKRNSITNHGDIRCCPQSYFVCDETYRMMELVYGLTRDDEHVFRNMLSRVPSLPYVVDFAPLHKAMCIDGVAKSPDHVDLHQPMSKICNNCHKDGFHAVGCNRNSMRTQCKECGRIGFHSRACSLKTPKYAAPVKSVFQLFGF